MDELFRPLIMSMQNMIMIKDEKAEGKLGSILACPLVCVELYHIDQ
jgi:hypothetical protein